MENTDNASVLTLALRIVKLFTGVGNNAAIGVLYDCHDRMKHHSRYGHGSVKREFVRTFKEWERYLHRIRYERGSYFGTDKMSDAERKRYGDTDADKMLEIWKGMGARLQARTWPLVTSLWNKFRLSLEECGIKEADAVAWALCCQTVLDIAVELYEIAIRDCCQHGIRPNTASRLFGVFSIKRVADCWRRAMYMMEPATKAYDKAETQEKNIDFGLQQLFEAWTSFENIIDSASETCLDFDDYFRTKGEAKKSAREWAGLKTEYLKNLANDG